MMIGENVILSFEEDSLLIVWEIDNRRITVFATDTAPYSDSLELLN